MEWRDFRDKIGGIVTPAWVRNARALLEQRIAEQGYPPVDPSDASYGRTDIEVRAMLGNPDRERTFRAFNSGVSKDAYPSDSPALALYDLDALYEKGLISQTEYESKREKLVWARVPAKSFNSSVGARGVQDMRTWEYWKIQNKDRGVLAVVVFMRDSRTKTISGDTWRVCSVVTAEAAR